MGFAVGAQAVLGAVALVGVTVAFGRRAIVDPRCQQLKQYEC